ncbi:unnamed protein product, partial [Strongylus vulgaris]
NEGVTDEDEESDDSVIYVEDEESEGEAYLGEDREATVLQNEGVTDEDEDSDDSVIYVEDEESEGEAYLGEDREATVLQYKNGDAISTLPDFDKFPFSDRDSSISATRAFAWMVAPCDVQTFFKDFFQSSALIAKRSMPNYYSNLFSVDRLVELLEKVSYFQGFQAKKLNTISFPFQNHLEYGLNVNIAEYKNGVRTTLNGTGRVYPSHLKEHLALGRSVQFVNPATFDDRVWYFCEILQEMFGCFVGANTYLTPAGTAGFAPHWDEIDAFLLQLEGKKYWKVYAPDSSDDELPLEPSGRSENFNDNDMKGRKPTFEGWIEAGDLLYIPRGYLTPAGTAGFAPHWDEIDAFLLQLEGKKYWKVYAPDSSDDELPLEPSGRSENFNDNDMKGRKPTFEGWIEAGDLLYIPRGFIHQGSTADDAHSFHLTISSGRQWSFANLMEKLVPEAIKGLTANRWKMRKSLPVGMLDMGGVAGIDYRMEEHFQEKWKSVLDRHMTVLRNSLREVCDGGIDLMAREFMKTALPPKLTDEEKTLSAVGIGSDILNDSPLEFRPSTRVKLIRRHAQR